MRLYAFAVFHSVVYRAERTTSATNCKVWESQIFLTSGLTLYERVVAAGLLATHPIYADPITGILCKTGPSPPYFGRLRHTWSLSV